MSYSATLFFLEWQAMLDKVKTGYTLNLQMIKPLICKLQVDIQIILHFVKKVLDFHFTL